MILPMLSEKKAVIALDTLPFMPDNCTFIPNFPAMEPLTRATARPPLLTDTADEIRLFNMAVCKVW